METPLTVSAKSVLAASPPSAAPAGAVDRPRIAKIVERVLAERGIVRGAAVTEGSTAVADTATTAPVLVASTPLPSAIASEIAARLFPSRSTTQTGSGRPLPAAATRPVSLKPAVEPAAKVSPFVSENDVRQAMFRSEKIYIGPKTIVTPSARDLALAHEVFIETKN